MPRSASRCLNDNLLGGLRCNAAERLSRDVDIDDIADHRVLLVLGCLLERDFLIRLVEILGLDNRLTHIHADGLLVAIRLNEHVIGHAVVVALVGGNERLADAVEHIIDRNTLFLFQLLQRVEKFCVNHFFQSSSFLYLDREAYRGNVLGS